MKVSIIAAVYKDVRALELIIDAMRRQTYKNFELVVAEDGDDPAIRECVAKVKDINILHTSQEDLGIRKSRSQNNAIIASTGTYLIFIDGDCIPYSNFIEGHIKLSQKDAVVAGRRVNLGQGYSSKLRSGEISPMHLEKSFLRHIPSLHKDGATHIEQGVALDRSGFMYNRLLCRFKRNTDLIGCNFSCYKRDILSINGFDESYPGTSLADDTDIQWRFVGNGLKLISGHNIANMFHLYHTRENRIVADDHLVAMNNKMNDRRKNKIFRCEEGISSH